LEQRLSDYAVVGFVVLCVFGIFRLSRILLKKLLETVEKRFGEPTPDHLLFMGFVFLLLGLVFLPSFTALLALLDNVHLLGGIWTHLVMVALSIILFSIAEDLFREFPGMAPSTKRWSPSAHAGRVAPALVLFWTVGVVFLSPIFYSGLTLLLSAFYVFALSCIPRHSKSR